MLKTVILSLLCLCAACIASFIASFGNTAIHVLNILLVHAAVWGWYVIRYVILPSMLAVWTAVLTAWWLARSSASLRMKILAVTCIVLWIVWKVWTDRKKAEDEKREERERSEMCWSFRSKMIVAEDKLIVAEEKLAKLAK